MQRLPAGVVSAAAWHVCTASGGMPASPERAASFSSVVPRLVRIAVAGWRGRDGGLLRAGGLLKRAGVPGALGELEQGAPRPDRYPAWSGCPAGVAATASPNSVMLSRSRGNWPV